jgi:hypothetical protein
VIREAFFVCASGGGRGGEGGRSGGRKSSRGRTVVSRVACSAAWCRDEGGRIAGGGGLELMNVWGGCADLNWSVGHYSHWWRGQMGGDGTEGGELWGFGGWLRLRRAGGVDG